MSHSFPKIIWQTHNYTLENMPDHVKMVCANWINLNPGWEYKYVDHFEREKFVSGYPEILNYYLASTPKVQSDIWRCLVTYEYGGSYADMDSVCIKPIEDVLKDIDNDIDLILVPKEFNSGSPGIGNYVVKEKSDVLSSVIKKLYDAGKFKDLWEDEWLAFNLFISSFKGREDISYNFTAARHSSGYHDVFPSDLEVSVFGKTISYDSFIKDNNLKNKYW